MSATVLVFGRRQRRDGPRAQLAGVLTCHPAIAVLSTGYRPLGSCSRAAGSSAATLC